MFLDYSSRQNFNSIVHGVTYLEKNLSPARNYWKQSKKSRLVRMGKPTIHKHSFFMTNLFEHPMTFRFNMITLEKWSNSQNVMAYSDSEFNSYISQI